MTKKLINTFLDCLGKKTGNSLILDALSTIACDFYIDTYEIAGEKRESWSFFSRGTDFSFKNDTLVAFFFYTKEKGKFSKFPFLDKLISGLTYQSSPEDIINILGNLEKKGKSSNGNYVRFKYDDKYIHFEFDENNKLSLITLFIEKAS